LKNFEDKIDQLLVICLYNDKSHKKLNELIDRGLAIAFMQQTKTGEYKPNISAISILINKLVDIRKKMKTTDRVVPEKFIKHPWEL
jgi:hypothetical protein